MKLIAFLVAGVSTAFAEEVMLLQAPAQSFPNFERLDTAIQLDTRNQQGFVRLSGVKSISDLECTPGDYGTQCYSVRYEVNAFTKNLNVEGLSLEGDKLVYRGTAGAVECASFGRSRVFRRPTLFLTGACKVGAEVKTVEGVRTIQVKFIAE